MRVCASVSASVCVCVCVLSKRMKKTKEQRMVGKGKATGRIYVNTIRELARSASQTP